jgi:hypothetical protein
MQHFSCLVPFLFFHFFARSFAAAAPHGFVCFRTMHLLCRKKGMI